MIFLDRVGSPSTSSAGVDTANPANGPMRDMLHSFMAIKRHGQPEEVAGMVAWLAGPEASFVTGAMHTIDGAFGA